ncbi:MAG: magnesium transporter CorA family protein [Planctomycetes bacterium]|nr:magnesium transporter CorA family protein [Planctomycetota bacterium]
MLKRLTICDGRLIEAKDAVCHVEIYIAPDDTDRRYLMDTCKIDEHTLHSALDPDELPRLEFEPDHVAMIFKRPKNYSAADEFLFKVASTGVFLFKERLIVVMSEDAQLFEVKQSNKIHNVQDALLRFMYRSIFHFLEHLKVIHLISDQLEQKIQQAMENRALINLFTLEKGMVYYLNAIHGNGIVIEKVKNMAARIGLTPEHVELLDDIVIENNQCYKQAEISSNILASLMDARVSIVSNNLNVVMKKLTLVMIAVMLPTLWTSFFSMNLPIPGAAGEPHPTLGYGMFFFVVGTAILMAVLLIWLWRRRGW